MCVCSISRISPSWARAGCKKTLCLLHYPRKIKFIHSFSLCLCLSLSLSLSVSLCLSVCLSVCLSLSLSHMCVCSISRISPSWARAGCKKTLCLLHYPRKIKFIHSFILSLSLSLSLGPVCIEERMCVYLCAFLPKIRRAAVKRRIHGDNAGLHGIIARIWRGSLETAVYEGPKDKLRNRWTGKRVIRTCILPRQLRIPAL